MLCEGPYSVNTYYQQNRHGDTVATSNYSGATIVTYEYDAFGNQLDADPNDTNPFRYCGQYLDNETGSYYLRARYYQPTYGRFLTADTHWNTDNMIYGDNPVKINERENPYNVNAPMSFAYLPDMTAVLQSGNLYGYGVNNPIKYYDYSGYFAYPGQIHNLVVKHVAAKYDLKMEQTINYDFGWGRADLISINGEVWDVKRDDAKQIAKGVTQVQKYVNNKWKGHEDIQLSVGGFIESDSFVVEFGVDTYYVSYRYAGDGIIAYDYTKVTDWEQIGEYAQQAGAALLFIASCIACIATGGAVAPAYAH